jgi:hypothetical protein
MNVRQHLPEVAHIHERAADRAISEMIRLGLSDAVRINAAILPNLDHRSHASLRRPQW